jgi:hypothetical protein
MRRANRRHFGDLGSSGRSVLPILGHPLTFVLFVFVGVTLLGAGSLLYLYSVVSIRE